MTNNYDEDLEYAAEHFLNWDDIPITKEGQILRQCLMDEKIQEAYQDGTDLNELLLTLIDDDIQEKWQELNPTDDPWGDAGISVSDFVSNDD